ncbi:MAG: hypothetical protein C0514_07285 [Candidatus Puniceispirillum sp.]|nr:hypothetical protein [Candidatus Puniceispirillum sp.]
MTNKNRRVPKARQAPGASKTKKRSAFGRLFLVLLNMAIWMGVVGAVIVFWFAYDLPSVDKLEHATRRPGVTLYAKDGSLLATYGDLYGQLVRLEDLPPYVGQAVVAIEDRRFYHHFGVDPVGLARAAYTNYRAGHVVQGGSTLTQQLAKDFLLQEGLYTYKDKSLRRKVQEVILALWLEWHFTKKQILTLYLNRAYLGAGVFGVDSAAIKYFGKHAKDLTLYEAAVLAGLLKAPSKFSPTANPALCDQRASLVLATMEDAGFIKAQDKQLALYMKTPLELIKRESTFGRYFADWVFDTLPDLVGPITQDLIVETTLDPRCQRMAEQEATQILDKHGQEAKVGQLALVSMTPSGAVRALVGGANYAKSPFNRATQAKRQTGSSFKIFVYVAAFELGMDPDTLISDMPIRIGSWQPRNFSTKTYQWVPKGSISLKDSFAYSINTSLVRLGQQMTVPRIQNMAKRLGLTSPQPGDLTLCLGSGDASLLEMTSAYATFANRGRGVWPYAVTKISTPAGETLYTRTHKVTQQVISPDVARNTLTLLQAVMSYGTGRKIALTRPSAGKSGTTQLHRDAWFIGMTPDMVTGVWMGNDDGKPTKDVTGGKYPGLLWKNYMERIHEGVPARSF